MKAYEFKFDRRKKLRVNELGAFAADTEMEFTLRLALSAGQSVHSAAMGIHRDAWNTGETGFLTFPMRPLPGEGNVYDWNKVIAGINELIEECGVSPKSDEIRDFLSSTTISARDSFFSFARISRLPPALPRVRSTTSSSTGSPKPGL